MTEKIDTGGFPLKHSPFDLTGTVNNFDTPASPATWPVPGDPGGGGGEPEPDEEFPDEEPTEEDPFPNDPELGDVIFDFNTEAFYAWDGTEWLQLNIEFPDSALPPWFTLITDAAANTVQIDGEGLLNFIPIGLPTSDPGGGRVWLSAT